ncbi:hypothetical protein B0T16DRAFT_407797 [Cercophora newfieldiana]|uniref:Uncharacterized protein n=1 Tax=Cercophora newfieldiana TaxID=92897 RepID=A0AA40CR59_9PEZI|nr:hypothetical protein B0T16DRAFT_407797 [Cercophora newfieldiana]
MTSIDDGDNEIALEYDPVLLDDDDDALDKGYQGTDPGLARVNDAEESVHQARATGSQLCFDIDLVAVDEGAAALRFNSEDIYIARSSGVVVRCTVADQVHGRLSATNNTLCSLLVFDFRFDLRRIATLHEIVTDLVLPGKVKVHRPHGVAPARTLSFKPQEVDRGRTTGNHITVGAEYMAKAEAGKTNEKREDMKVTEYAEAIGWTRFWPEERYNDPSPHNCVSWSVKKNPALKHDGLPRHFRAAVLLEREEGVDQFELSMHIRSSADLVSTLLNTLRGSIPAGRLKLDAADPPTNNLRTYGPASPESVVFLGGINLEDFAELSQGKLQEWVFDRPKNGPEKGTDADNAPAAIDK